MNTEISYISKAIDLPDSWDSEAVDYFQTREFLDHTEKYNPCYQRYYLLYHNGIFKIGVVVYSLRLNLLTFLHIASPFQMKIAGIPCSVSASGVIGDHSFLDQIIAQIKIREQGMLLFLNLSSGLMAEKMIPGRTLPTVILTNHFSSFENYFSALRSSYRRRINHLMLPFTGIQIKRLPCADFDRQMYALYLEVLRRSKGKLEKLSIVFFQRLPSNFNLIALYRNEQILGWYITSAFGKKFYFFLGGLDYRENNRYNTYFNILINVVKDGIQERASLIDLGQTAEIPKLRLGGRLIEKTMLAYHSNLLMRKLIMAGKGLLEYPDEIRESHVFKEIR